MYNSWYLFSLVALLLYGAWGYWGTRAADYINPLSITFYSSLGVLIAGVVALSLLNFKLEHSIKGNSYALLNGLANGIACIFFIAALKKGPTMPVVLITSMYPLITLLLSAFFLGQGLTSKQIWGMGFAVIALILFSIE